jgi:hypothetical protein
MGRTTHVAHIGEKKNACKILIGNLRGKDLGVNNSTILNWIFMENRI